MNIVLRFLRGFRAPTKEQLTAKLAEVNAKLNKALSPSAPAGSLEEVHGLYKQQKEIGDKLHELGS